MNVEKREVFVYKGMKNAVLFENQHGAPVQTDVIRPGELIIIDEVDDKCVRVISSRFKKGWCYFSHTSFVKPEADEMITEELP